TEGTVNSGSYPLEIAHFAPDVKVFVQSCPMWVPIIEDGEANSDVAHYYVKKYLRQLLAKSPDIDTLLLACTHYPILQPTIEDELPPSIKVVAQGELVASSLENYLWRHPQLEAQISKKGS